jgi:hypothetical protein
MLILLQELATLPHRATLLPFPLSESVLTEPSSVTHCTFPYVLAISFFLIGKVAVPEAFPLRERERFSLISQSKTGWLQHGVGNGLRI